MLPETYIEAIVNLSIDCLASNIVGDSDGARVLRSLRSGSARHVGISPDQSLQAMVTRLVGRSIERGRISAPRARGGLAPHHLRRALQDIEHGLSGRLEIATLARALGLSRKHFTRAFRQSTGTSPHRWILQQRIERAQHLLATTGEAIAEIALSCGFADQSHMTATFRRMAGMTPGVYRREHCASALP